MKKKILGIFVCMLLIVMVLPAAGVINEEELVANLAIRQERDYGDAPEGPQAIAYPSLGVTGSFPTCKYSGPAAWVEHNNFGAWFGLGVDFEPEGNGGMCPNCFPPYDQDETFQDGDAGLIMPDPYTIDNALNVVPIPPGVGTPLGIIGQTAVWGTDIDIQVDNHMPGHEPYLDAFVNVLIDKNQNGVWGDPGEHVLINFIVPALYKGPLSALGPPNFAIGPNPGFVWVRFSITEKPVKTDWMGDGEFEDGESEDYLLEVKDVSQPVPHLTCRGGIAWKTISNPQPGGTKTGTFDVGNNGDPGSLLNWQVTSWPSWGTNWAFSPSSGTGLAEGSWTTVTVTCDAPNQQNQQFSGNITVCNTDDPSNCCQVPVTLETSRNRAVNIPFLRFLQLFPNIIIVLKYLFGQ